MSYEISFKMVDKEVNFIFIWSVCSGLWSIFEHIILPAKKKFKSNFKQSHIANFGLGV